MTDLIEAGDQLGGCYNNIGNVQWGPELRGEKESDGKNAAEVEPGRLEGPDSDTDRNREV